MQPKNDDDFTFVVTVRRAGTKDYFPDDEFCACHDCGAEVRYRPYMPPLPKICLQCFGDRMDSGGRVN